MSVFPQSSGEPSQQSVPAPSAPGVFDRIVLAVEEDTDEAVAETAVALAVAHDATLDVLSVVRMWSSVDNWDSAVERRETSAERALDTVGELATDAGVEVRKRLRYGTPAEEIGLYAEGNDADIVVAGEPSRGRLGRLFSGRATMGDVRRAVSMPVMTVPSV
ncbi:MAG: universal stress protein [Halobacteriales archaeon]|nr:universal stress protein [Halobacteriales archaeon]